MKNTLKLSPLALVLFINPPAHADSAAASNGEVETQSKREYAGHRIGAGLVSGAELITNLEFDKDYGWEPTHPQHVKHIDPLHGFKIEYGYDFNRIVALNVSYINLSHDVQDFHTVGMGPFEYYKSSQANLGTLSIDAEVGYAFALGKFDLKPYAAAGIGFTQGSSATYVETTAKKKYQHDRMNEATTYLALGARLNTPIGLYVDARTGGPIGNTFTITTGYKF
jgi:hypothetical protein